MSIGPSPNVSGNLFCGSAPSDGSADASTATADLNTTSCPQPDKCPTPWDQMLYGQFDPASASPDGSGCGCQNS